MSPHTHLALGGLLVLSLAAASARAAEAPAEAEPRKAVPAQALGETEDQVKWTRGPIKASLGTEAEVDLEEAFVFANAADTRKALYAMGNRPSGNELGMIAPADPNQDWILVFKYLPVGYVADDEKDKVDAEALLESIKKGTEEANQERAARGIPGLHINGWRDPPRYDEKTHQFSWALLARSDDGHDVVNYNVRLLGREGYMSVTLADDPKNLEASRPVVERILQRFSFKSGKSYAEYRPGDKLAEYGLTALVAGGAGVAATKLGLFAVLGKMLGKAWKAVAVGAVALVAAIKRFFTGERPGNTEG